MTYLCITITTKKLNQTTHIMTNGCLVIEMSFTVKTFEDIDRIYYGIHHLKWCVDTCLTDDMPDSVIYLTFGGRFEESIRTCDIPDSVTHLKISPCMPKLKKGHIPASVTHLRFSCCLGQQIEIGYIPNSVTYLNF